MSHPLVKIDKKVLARVRRICLGWPEASEDIKWGRPPEWVLTPYSAHQGWITRYTDVPVDWDEITDYLRVGYRLVAFKRMLDAMDTGESHAG